MCASAGVVSPTAAAAAVGRYKVLQSALSQHSIGGHCVFEARQTRLYLDCVVFRSSQLLDSMRASKQASAASPTKPLPSPLLAPTLGAYEPRARTWPAKQRRRRAALQCARALAAFGLEAQLAGWLAHFAAVARASPTSFLVAQNTLLYFHRTPSQACHRRLELAPTREPSLPSIWLFADST